MGWLIFLAVLAALNCRPLGGRIRFDGQSFSAGVLIGKLPIRLYPLPDWLKRKKAITCVINCKSGHLNALPCTWRLSTREVRCGSTDKWPLYYEAGILRI